jgi:hypothetical protein
MDGAGDKNGGNKPPIRPTVSLNQTLAWSGTSQLPAEVWGEEDSGNGKFASGSFRRRGPGSGPNSLNPRMTKTFLGQLKPNCNLVTGLLSTRSSANWAAGEWALFT